MTSSPGDPEGDRPSPSFTFDELADLRAGELTAEQEEDLLMRLQQDPERAGGMLAALERVDAAFPEPANYHDPLAIPADLDARLQGLINQATTGSREDHNEPGQGGPDAGDLPRS